MAKNDGDKPKSNKMLIGILAGVGGLLLLCCICGGGGAGIYFFAFSGPSGDVSKEKYDSLTIGLTPEEVDAHLAGKGLKTDLKGAADFARRNGRDDVAGKIPANYETFLCYGNRDKMLIVGFTKTDKYGLLNISKTLAERQGSAMQSFTSSGGDPAAVRDKKSKK